MIALALSALVAHAHAFAQPPPASPSAPPPAAPVAADATPAPPPAKRVAVMKTEITGDIDPALGPQLTAKLAQAVRRQTGAEVISSDEIVALLKHEKDRAILGECKEQESCLAEIASALGTESIVAARIARVAGATAITVSLVDAQTAAVTGRVSESWGGDVVQMLSLADPIVTRLYATTGIPKGAISVIGAIPGSKIVVDGEVRGSSELAKIPDVLIGAHHVVVQSEDAPPVDSWVIVEADRTVSIPVAQETPFYKSWWFWTATGGGVVVASATAIGVAYALAGAPGKTGVNVALNADKVLGGAR